MSRLVLGVVAASVTVVAAPTAEAFPGQRQLPQMESAVEPVLRRCPPGWRRTLGGCVRIRPTWWQALLGA